MIKVALRRHHRQHYKRVLISLLLTLHIALPNLVFAQSTPLDPGQDPFALTPEKLQLFQGYEGSNSLNSLFNGESMKNNGLFATSVRQLGGASPDLTSPIRDNEEEVQQGPTFLVVKSEYSPSGDLTKDSIINLKVTLHNIGQNTAQNIVLTACVQDNYIILLNDPAPSPPFTNNPEDSTQQPEITDADPDTEADSTPTPFPTIVDPTINDCYMKLEWNALENGEPITLKADEEAIFTWSFQPQKDDVVIRWRFVASFGAGQSVLRQWIPVKNPNPTGGIAPGGGPGIPSTCSSTGQTEPFPSNSTTQQIFAAFQQKWNITFVNAAYDWGSPQYKPYLQGFWEAISSVECTPFVGNVTKNGPLKLIASAEPSYWGWQKSENEIHYNLGNMLAQGAASGSPAQFHQFAIHELGHVFMSKNFAIFENFQNSICGRGSPRGNVSGYGEVGGCKEDFAEAIGYYAIRASHEQGIGTERCPQKNPYDWGWSTYYEFLKTNVFGNVEFGSPAPSSPTSC